jgi:1,4-dihydroxy-2-naphthoate octaprenyltransferase
LFLLTVGAVLAVNGAGNMVNSYFDSMRKLDPHKSPLPSPVEEHRGGVGGGAESEMQQRRHIRGGENGCVSDERPLQQQHQLDHSALVNYAAYLYGFGMLCMLMLMALSRAKSEFIAALFFGGLSSSFLYTGGIGLKYYILGDLLVVFTFGPLSMLFSYGVQSGHFPLGPLILALPLALSTEAILHSKHLREVEEDKREGMISLAVVLGRQGSYFFFALLLFLPYLLFAVFASGYSLLLGLPLLSMPYAFQLERSLREVGPSRAISIKAARLNIVVSTLFILGCLLARELPFIEVEP